MHPIGAQIKTLVSNTVSRCLRSRSTLVEQLSPEPDKLNTLNDMGTASTLCQRRVAAQVSPRNVEKLENKKNLKKLEKDLRRIVLEVVI